MNQEFSEAYSEGGFWETMSKLTHTLGKDAKELAMKALTLYYCVRDKAVPISVKFVVIGALGYLIMPFDMTPDFIPAIGWLDDLIVIRSAYLFAAGSITVAHRTSAETAWKARFDRKKTTSNVTEAEVKVEEAEVVTETPKA